MQAAARTRPSGSVKRPMNSSAASVSRVAETAPTRASAEDIGGGMRAAGAIRHLMVAAQLMLVSGMLGGCAATQTLLAKKGLVAQSRASTAVFADPVARPTR